MAERTDDDGEEPHDAAKRRPGAAHSVGLKTGAGGLRFEAYLPAELALWLLDWIETGVFMDPSDALLVVLDEQKDLATYPDLYAVLRPTIRRQRTIRPFRSTRSWPNCARVLPRRARRRRWSATRPSPVPASTDPAGLPSR